MAKRSLLRRALRVLLWSGLFVMVAGGGVVTGALLVRDWVRDYNRDVDRIIAKDGIDEGSYVTIGGVRQWIHVRGMDRHQPILLYLHGGPGGAISDQAYAFQKPWEDYFTVVQWDQRGFGRSAIDLDKMQPLTKDQLVADAIELIELLRKRYDQPKIVLVGQSFGTILGATIAKQRPDLLYAYVGMAQATGWKRIFIESRDTMIADAERTGDKQLLQQLQDAGPPPAGNDPMTFLAWTGKVQAPSATRGGFWYNAKDGLDVGLRFLTWQIMLPTVSLGDIFHALTNRADPNKTTLSVVASIMDWDFRKDVGTKFDVPVIFIQGRHDLTTPFESARLLESELDAPSKAFVALDHSSHVLLVEEPGRVLAALVQTVLPLTKQ